MPSKNEDLSSIQSDVASFLSGLGFSSHAFDDSDFRKKGRISDSKPEPAQKVSTTDKPWRSSEPKDASKKKSKASGNGKLKKSKASGNEKLKKSVSDSKPAPAQRVSTADKPWRSSEPKYASKKSKASGNENLKASGNEKLKKSVSKEKSRSEDAEKPYAKREARGGLSRTRETGKGEKTRNFREASGMSSENKLGKKERAGFMAKTEADTDARPIANVSSKKRKAVFTEKDQSANGKKLKVNECKSPGLLNQGLTTKENFTKEGSKSLSRIVSLFGSGPWYEVSTSFAVMNGKNHAVNGESQCVVKNNDGLEWNALVENVRKKGEQLFDTVAAEYEKSRGKDSDMRWVMMARKTGTTADKVAAFTVLLQDNAVANLRSLNALLGLVTSKGGKRHAGMGMDALKELFVTSLLPDRKLKFVMQQPIQAQVGTREEECQMLLWYWEDCLKQRYEHFIASLEEASKDNLPFLKEKALKTIYELLKSKPEQEQRLLSALVNKLGDPERKTASNAGYYLSCLVTAHPNMKMVVVQEVDSFLFRPHLVLRSKYQAVVFLNQIMLSNRGDGPKLARRLIDIYFSLFKVITTSKPRSPHEEWSSMKNQRKANKIEEEDAGVVEIDSRLLSALLTGVNRAFPYVAAEEVDTLVEEHTPVLFRLVHSKSFNVGVQALMLLYQLVTKKNAISDRLYRSLYAVLLSPGLSKSSKMEMFLGLVFKAIKSDINSKRMAAFAKRLLQVALQGAPQFACGCLLLLSEVLKSRPTLWHAVSHTEDADDEIEHFEDVKDNDMSRTGLLHTDNLADSPQNQSADNEVECGGWLKEGHYNARHRDPSFCNADRACWWELIALKFHAHPSVAAMAKTLLSGSSILYDGDPLRDLAVGAFLDRFAEKKPKAHRRNETWHGSLPLAPSKKVSPLPVGSDFLNLTEKEVAPEDVIFHKFYTSKAGRKTKSIKFDKREEDVLLTGDDDLLGDESDDDEIDALLDEDEGAEMGLDDLSEEDDESEGEWTYHQQSEGNLNASNGEHIGFEEDSDFEGLSFDEENANGAGFQESMEHSVNLKSGFNKSARGHSQSKQRKKEKRGKEKKTFEKRGVAKSPFADFDEYSHILKHDTTGAERRFTSSKREP